MVARWFAGFFGYFGFGFWPGAGASVGCASD